MGDLRAPIPNTRPAPRRIGAGQRRTSYALVRWLFLRVSGLVLLGLVLAHLFANLMVGDGINAINFALVAGRYANPFWQTWSLVMLWLALLHGHAGMSGMIDDYAEKPGSRLWLKGLLAVATAFTIALGTLVIFTFDPCPVTARPDLLPSFCAAQ